ncbi:unnamed protein product [Lampetra planeri]
MSSRELATSDAIGPHHVALGNSLSAPGAGGGGCLHRRLRNGRSCRFCRSCRRRRCLRGRPKQAVTSRRAGVGAAILLGEEGM